MFKQVVKRIDAALLGGSVARLGARYRERKFMRALGTDLEHRYVVHYRKDRQCLLSELCDKYGSDKGHVAGDKAYPWPAHTYADFYSRLFEGRRLDVRRVFECGLGSTSPRFAANMGANGKPGASLRVWRDYFPNAQIVGADIDREILFEEHRIRTHYFDQTDPGTIDDFLSKVGPGSFDFILDDGLHTFAAGVTLFEKMVPTLSASGIYVIEDVRMHAMLQFKSYFEGRNYRVDYVSLMRPDLELGDNNLVVIRQPSSHTHPGG